MSNENFTTPPSDSGSGSRRRSRLPSGLQPNDDIFRLDSSPNPFPPFFSPQPPFSFSGLLSGNPVGFQQPYFYDQPPQFPTSSHFQMPRETQEEDSDDEVEEEATHEVEEDDVDEEEIIPETQPNRSKRKSRQQTTGRAPNRKWNDQEEVALATAWVDTSEDSVIGTNQKRSDFWLRVTTKFNEIMSPNHRSYDQINSKWRELNRKCAVFTGIYNNAKNNWRSGASDADIINLAMDRYRQENNGKPFVYLKAWNILRESPKWSSVGPMEVPHSQASKRSKTSSSPMSSDGRCQVNVNSPILPNEEVDEAIPNPLPRPPGRNKGKQASSSSQSTANDEQMNLLLEQVMQFNTRHEKLFELKAEQMEIRRQQQELKDFDYYMKPHDHLTGATLAWTLRKKQSLREKYGWD